MTKEVKKPKAGWIVGMAVLCGIAVIVPSMVSLGTSLFAAVVALIS